MTHTTPSRWSKSHPNWGSALRIQRNAYAYLVTMVMTDGLLLCPACDGDLDLDTAEVDRAVPALDYAEGNVAYLCRGCNQSRALLQAAGRDWSGADDYADAVREASALVDVPTQAEARRWWADRPVSAPRVSRWA